MTERHVVALHLVLAGNIVEHRMEVRLGLGSSVTKAHLGIGRTGIDRLAVGTQVFLDQSREYTHALARAHRVSVRGKGAVQGFIGIVDNSRKRERAGTFHIGVLGVPAARTVIGPHGVVRDKENRRGRIDIVQHRKVARVRIGIVIPHAVHAQLDIRCILQVKDNIGRSRIKHHVVPAAIVRRGNHGRILPDPLRSGVANHQFIGLPFLLFGY